MNEEQLTAFYADNARRWETAKREFGEREHGWRPFALAAGAGQWAESFAGGGSAGSGSGSGSGSAATAAADGDDKGHPHDPSAWAAHLVEQADADGVIIKPEPGSIRSAYSHRDSQTEMDTAIGFGFYPDASEVLVVHADHAIYYDAITPAIGGDGVAVLAVLRAVVESFGTVRPFAVSGRG